ncbi:MAG: hypothetical protein JWO60_1701 [Frankiales bacterium]|nr:hypothetical protein [Frankiales bacterium]
MDTASSTTSSPLPPVVPPVRPAAPPGLSRTALLVSVALLVGVLARSATRSALWLDEALSVNIASLPLSDLPAALRRDGAPPVYYVLLHGWTSVFGGSDAAVRALSQLCSLVSLPLAWLAGVRLHSRAAGWAAVLLLASNPFAVRYATEARMYALVVLLVLLGALALDAALRSPRPVRLLAVGVLGALLGLTHYWALFLLAVVGAGLLVAARRGPRRYPARRCALALLAGGLLFLPWLPVFLFQAAHTGAPWAVPPDLGDVVLTWFDWSGPGLSGAVLGLLLLGLALAGPFLRPAPGGGLLLRRPARRIVLVLSAVAFGTLALGVGVAVVQSSGYALRYSAVALVPALLAAAVAAQGLPARGRTAVLALAVVLGSVTSVQLPFQDVRTQAAVTAAVLEPALRPGDLVLYCPDQLGPAMARQLPASTDQLVYPTGGPPQRVDWVDYAERNRAGDPDRFAAAADRRARGAVWLVTAQGYRTFGDSCQRLASALQARRGPAQRVVTPRARFEERQTVLRYGPA